MFENSVIKIQNKNFILFKMVYARKNRMRKNLRNNRTLSTKRIFNNKSAKAQASQIWALRKRINRVYQRTKPEFKLLRRDVENRGFGYNSGALYAPSLINSLILPIHVPVAGTGDNERIGNKITIYPVNFFLNIRYMERNNVLNNLSPYITTQLDTDGMILRFVAIQQISASSEVPPIGEIFSNVEIGQGATSQEMMMNMTTPFKNGITTKFKILKDKRINVSKDKPIYAARFKIKPQIKSLRWEDNETYPAGMIWYIMLSAGGELIVKAADAGSQTFTHFNELDTTWRYELTYTDA